MKSGSFRDIAIPQFVKETFNIFDVPKAVLLLVGPANGSFRGDDEFLAQDVHWALHQRLREDPSIPYDLRVR